MNTNQEKVIQLIGKENYRLLLANGYYPLEIDFFKKMVSSRTRENVKETNIVFLAH